MRQLGYRHAIGSISSALARSWDSVLIVAYTDGTFGGRPSEDGERTIARALGFSQRGQRSTRSSTGCFSESPLRGPSTSGEEGVSSLREVGREVPISALR